MERRLSTGGQSEVYLARRVRDDVPVALKVVREDGPAGIAGIERLRREAHLLLRVSHRNVVRVLECGECEGLVYLALEYLEGEDLAACIDRAAGRQPPSSPAAARTTLVRTDLPADAASPPRPNLTRAPAPPAFLAADHHRWVARVGVDLCHALEAIHSQSLLHRDLNPNNVRLLPDGRIVVTDFGLATAPDLQRITATKELLGTVPYMAPEQAHAGRLDRRTDVYAAGATLYECLAGRPPFDGLLAGQILRELGRGAPVPVRAVNRALAADFAYVIERAMATDPRDRYPDAPALRADLEAILAGRPVRRRWFVHDTMRRARWPAAAALVLAVAAGLYVWRDNPVRRNLQKLLDDGKVAEARDAWRALDDETRATELEHVRRQEHSYKPDVALAFLAAPGQALLRLRASPGHRYWLGRADRDLGGGGPASVAECQPLAATALVPLAPGYWKLVLVPSDEAQWWSATDPLAYTLLLQVELAPARAFVDLDPERCLPDARTRTMVKLAICKEDPSPWARFGAGKHRACIADTVREIGFARGLAVGRYETSRAELSFYREWLRHDPARADTFRHPDEPAGVDPFAGARVAAGDTAAGWLPALGSFWLAHRLAGFLGGRLPTLEEWAVAMQQDLNLVPEKLLNPQDAKPVANPNDPATHRDVMGPCGTDVTSGGIHFPLGNAREWTLTRGRDGRHAPIDVFLKDKPGGGSECYHALRTHALVPTAWDAASVDKPNGLRLYREPLAAR